MPSQPIRRVKLDEGPVLFGPDGKRITARVADQTAGSRPQPHPGDPFIPQMERADPRSRIPRVAQNLQITPRSEEPHRLSFETIRELATFDLCEIARADLKGQIQGMEWSVQPIKEFKRDHDAQETAKRVEEFLQVMDPLEDVDFEEWIGEALEEMVVTDALTVFPHYTRGNEPLGLELVDGASIKPLLDERGRKPVPPSPAYQQIVQGRVEAQWTMLELWYLPTCRRIDSIYGYSATEKVAITVNTAIRRALFDLAYFTDGDIPDSLYALPKEWKPDQIKTFQNNWQDMLEGRAEKRSGRLLFVPEGSYHALKDRPFSQEEMEYLVRVVAWAHGVSPMPMVKISGLGGGKPAEMMDLHAAETGVRPKARALAKVLNRYIRRVLGYKTVEFAWGGDEDEDPATTISRHASQATIMAISPDEVRGDSSMDPLPGGLGDEPIAQTPNGPMKLSIAMALAEEKTRAEIQTATAPRVPGGFSRVARAAQVEPGSANLIESELRQWQRAALKRLAKPAGARKPWEFTASHIPGPAQQAIRMALHKAATADQVRLAFQGGGLKKKEQTRKSPASGDPLSESGQLSMAGSERTGNGSLMQP